MMAGRCDAYGVGHCDYVVVVLVVYDMDDFISKSITVQHGNAVMFQVVSTNICESEYYIQL